MSKTATTFEERADGDMRGGTLFDYLFALVKWRRWIAINFIAVCLLTTMIVFLLPKWYRATTTIMPPRKDFGVLGLSTVIDNLPFAGFDLLKGSEDLLIYVAILNSRTVMESVAEKFDLQRIYEVEDPEKAVKALRKNVEIRIEKEGIISVSVLDNDRQRVAAMANAFAEYLDSLNVELNIEKARNNRIFIERRFDQNKEDLRRAEEELKAFQEKYGAIALPEQTAAAIKGAAELQAKIMLTEVELRLMEKYLAPTHDEVVRKRNELAELRKKLNEMKYGSGSVADGKVNEDLFIPFIEVPQVGLDYARRFRELEVQKTLYQLLIQQYEQAKIQEAKDVPTVQVLDKAIPPLRKAKPKRLTIVLLSGISATFIFIFFIFASERLRLLQHEDPQRYQKIASGFRIARKAPTYE